MTEQLPAAVERFLHGVETGDWDGMAAHLTEDVLYDASVPGWHYQYEGAERLVQEYREEWTGKHPWHLVERHVTIAPGTVVVDFEMHGRCPGDSEHGAHEEACRLANFFRLEDGRIAEHRYYCCGEWDEATLRRIEAEAPKVDRARRVGTAVES